MGNLSVLFSLPTAIEAGLATGQLQRIGGVIVDSSSKQVVAWLRETSVIGQSMPKSNLFNVVGQFSKMTPLLSLGFLTFAFNEINTRLNEIFDEINTHTVAIQAEFAQDRETQLKVALEAVHDVFEGNDDIYANALRSALDGLIAARENLMKDFEKILQSEIATPKKLRLAQYLLAYAMNIETTRIRCYIVAHEQELARKKITEVLPLFRDACIKFISACVGDYPALFLHKDFEDDVVSRFFQVQFWLKQNDDNGTILDILNQLRGDFWDVNLVDDKFENIVQQFMRKPILTWQEKVQRLKLGLEYAEEMIENYHRLEGFELELRAERLILMDEFNLNNEEFKHQGMALIVDDDVMQQIVRQNLPKPPHQ